MAWVVALWTLCATGNDGGYDGGYAAWIVSHYSTNFYAFSNPYRIKIIVSACIKQSVLYTGSS